MAQLSPDVIAIMKEWGYSAKKIATWSPETRLLHDIHMDRDCIRDLIFITLKEYNVKIELESFREYIPQPLWDYEIWRFDFIPYIRRRIERNCKPITLKMLEDAIAQGRFPPIGQ